jgi:D-aminopeptidase
VKVWISCDMEGVAGVVDWSQCTPDDPVAYARGCADTPVRLELDTRTGDMAEVATWVDGVERLDQRTVLITGDDLLGLFQRFVAVNYITRQAGGR